MNFRIPLSAPDIGQAEIDNVIAVLRCPQLSLGPELDAFEQEFAAFHHVSEAVAVSSGTAGLHLSLLIHGIGPGDEIIIPSFAFVAVANVVLQVGATPVFAEIDPVTLNLNPTAVEQAISDKTRVILVVHTFGVPAAMIELAAIAHKFGVALIEDACEALGAECDGQPVGSLGDAAVFGFYPNKQITTGEGGMVLVRNVEKAARLRSLRNQGRAPNVDWLDHAEPGYNYRLPEVACAMGRAQLQRLAEILALRVEAAKRYDDLLSEVQGIELPSRARTGDKMSWFVYVVRLPNTVDRNHVQRAMAAKGVATGRYFPPIHLQPAWQSRTASMSIRLPVTESIAERTLALPFFNRITALQQGDVVDVLVAAIGG